MFKKIGEAFEISSIVDSQSSAVALNKDILEKFTKFASDLKKVAPKAEDFLYFSAVMMHAAEASAINDDGSPKLNAKGEVVEVGWDKKNGSMKWVTNDPTIRPYKNANADVFPAEELIKAHNKWVGKPLCIDHKSSSVDHVRGFIVDTYYDHVLKRVVALCALDKINYPDLARKVVTGYSNSVSMGTGVSKAICTDCGTVARVESEFCKCMRNRTCYGEINVDLNPIELSIVVNGADPKANIKEIIASVQNLNNYVDSKQNELNKLAAFHAKISFGNELNEEDSENKGIYNTEISISSDDLESFQTDVQKAIDDFKTLQDSLKEKSEDDATNSYALNQSSGTFSMDETEVPNTDSELSPPHERFASSNELDTISNINKVMASLESKLGIMKQSLDQLVSNTSKNIQEEYMSGSKEINKKGYFQGTEEPTPGKPRYEVDPLNEVSRNETDKHMVGAEPFPGVGGQGELYPGDLERKKMLARAEAEERAMKRTAIVDMAKKALENKKAYYQNGEDKENAGTPTPGKTKYKADKLNEEARNNDKHMVGKKPFPEVDGEEGLYGDDFKKKQMLNRASLRARFVKAANTDGSQNIDNSSWEVYLGDKLLLTASVNELSGGQSEMMYDTIATKDFGSKLIEKVKKQGADKVKSLVKKAQMPAAEAPAEVQVEDMTAVEPEVVEAPKAPTEEKSEEMSNEKASGDAKEVAVEIAEKLRDLGSDMVEAVRALTGEQAEMGEMEAKASDEFSGVLNGLRKELNSNLIQAMKQSVANLSSHKEELDMIVKICNKGTNVNNELTGPIFDDAFVSAKSAIADGFKLMTAFVKYARGTKAIVKRAEIESQLKSLAEEEVAEEMLAADDEGDSLMSLVDEMDADSNDEEVDSELDEELKDLFDMSADDNNLMATQEELKNLEVKPGTKVEVTASYNNKSGRAALRSKLAADTLEMSSLLDAAHPEGGTMMDLGDVKPSDNLALVEDLKETHDAMMDVVNAPPKARKEAEAIHRLVSEGKLDPADLDALVSEGLDKDAVAYYKKYYNQAEGGSEFVNELVKEHVKAKMDEELNNFKVKMARAYELTYDMVDRGLCSSDRVSVSTQVDEIMKFNNESFDSLKRVVARHEPVLRKTAGRLPQVGLYNESTNNNSTQESNLFEELSAAFAKSSKRMF